MFTIHSNIHKPGVSPGKRASLLLLPAFFTPGLLISRVEPISSSLQVPLEQSLYVVIISYILTGDLHSTTTPLSHTNPPVACDNSF